MERPQDGDDTIRFKATTKEKMATGTGFSCLLSNFSKLYRLGKPFRMLRTFQIVLGGFGRPGAPLGAYGRLRAFAGVCGRSRAFAGVSGVFYSSWKVSLQAYTVPTDRLSRVVSRREDAGGRKQGHSIGSKPSSVRRLQRSIRRSGR